MEGSSADVYNEPAMRQPSVRAVSGDDLALDVTAGDAAAVELEARRCVRTTRDDTIRAIDGRLAFLKDFDLGWMSPDRRLRSTSEMLALNKAWGCSAIAQIACHLARAGGIPAILVKSMDDSWLANKTADGRGAGHVFVEILADGNRRLWSPKYGFINSHICGAVSVDDGDPRGPRRIYDTGHPCELVLSHHGPHWEEETKRLFPA